LLPPLYCLQQHTAETKLEDGQTEEHTYEVDRQPENIMPSVTLLGGEDITRKYISGKLKGCAEKLV